MPQEVLWQSDALPNGAFAKIHDIMAGGRHAVLAAIELNETVLAFKISGPGQGPTLSAFVKPSMKVMTIRVNHVEGVGGFVLLGDHIEVVLTRQIDAGSGTTMVVTRAAAKQAYTVPAEGRHGVSAEIGRRSAAW